MFEERLAEYQRSLPSFPAMLGDGLGNVTITGRPGMVRCRIGDSQTPAIVFNKRAPNTEDLPVVIGYDAAEPQLFQVLAIREVYAGAGYELIPQIQLHHETHEWASTSGGYDTVYVHLRQWMPLQVRVSSGLIVKVEAGPCPRDDKWAWISAQTLDLSSSVPTGAGARYVLVYLDEDGVIQGREGDEVRPASDLDFATNVPTVGLIEIPLAAVQLQRGQTTITDTVAAGEIIDLRYPQAVPAAEGLLLKMLAALESEIDLVTSTLALEHDDLKRQIAWLSAERDFAATKHAIEG